mgnify:CR=1 FL=1
MHILVSIQFKLRAFSPSINYQLVIVFAEILAVEDLYTNATARSEIPIIVFNGELDRIRSGCILKQYFILLNALIISIRSTCITYELPFF